MKKILVLMLCFVLLLGVASLVTAQENNTNSTDNNETDADHYAGLGDSCEKDTDCNESQECEDGECNISYGNDDLEIECESDANCKDNEYCVAGECEEQEEQANDLANESREDKYSDSEDEEESELFTTNKGALVRLTQLEMAIEKAITRAEVVIDFLDNNTNGSVEELEGIVDDLKDILEEVNILKEKDPTNVEEFVALKKQSRDLLKDFRDASRDLVKEVNMQELKRALRDANYSKVKELKNKVMEKIREHNAERVQKMLERFGENNPEIVKRIKQNGMTRAEISKEVLKKWKNAAEERREQLKNRIEEAKEERANAMERAKEALQKAKENRVKARSSVRARR